MWFVSPQLISSFCRSANFGCFIELRHFTKERKSVSSTLLTIATGTFTSAFRVASNFRLAVGGIRLITLQKSVSVIVSDNVLLFIPEISFCIFKIFLFHCNSGTVKPV